MLRTPQKATKSAVAGIHFFVIPTLKDGRRLVTGTPQEVADEVQAKNRIATMPPTAIGMAAYEVEFDAEGEQVAEPALIARAGKVPGLEDERLSEDA